MKLQLSSKRLQIDKAEATMVAILAIASAVTIFSLVAAKSLFSQSAYQQRVIAARMKAKKQLQVNIKSSKTLVETYRQFELAPESVIGTKDPNSKIVLDALPSKYDFPALASSLEKILTEGGYRIEAIDGTDDESAQALQGSSPNPEPMDMPFQITVGGSYPAIQKLVSDFERSIRPFNIASMELTGNDAAMRITVQAKTYYQPEKNLEIRTKDIK